jgi:hypothetical protein
MAEGCAVVGGGRLDGGVEAQPRKRVTSGARKSLEAFILGSCHFYVLLISEVLAPELGEAVCLSSSALAAA